MFFNFKKYNNNDVEYIINLKNVKYIVKLQKTQINFYFIDGSCEIHNNISLHKITELYKLLNIDKIIQ